MITYTLKKENLQKFDFMKENFQKNKYGIQKNCKFIRNQKNKPIMLLLLCSLVDKRIHIGGRVCLIKRS